MVIGICEQSNLGKVYNSLPTKTVGVEVANKLEIRFGLSTKVSVQNIFYWTGYRGKL